MEATAAKGKDNKNFSKHGLNLGLLEEKVVILIELVKALKEENAALKSKVKDLQNQLKAIEGSLVEETKGLEALSQEKVVAKMAVDNLLSSIDALFEVKEK